jgi:PEP-CTERM motif
LHNNNLFNGALPTAAVPEPATWAMFGIGFASLAGMGVFRRRSNRDTARYAL